ncbi:MAG: PAS domain-containing protein [Alphaproteobacteria bacterium]|nr:PAS domain-containing protein [Alphaproteobacteria bacterium]
MQAAVHDSAVVVLEQVVLSGTPPAHLPDDLTALYCWWEDVRADAALPARAVIDPFSLRSWLGNLSLLERVEEDWRYRLYGSTLAEAAGFDLTGRRLSASFAPIVQRFYIDQYSLVTSALRPVYSRNTRPARLQITARVWERLVMPFAGRSGGADFLLVFARALD